MNVFNVTHSKIMSCMSLVSITREYLLLATELHPMCTM